VANRQNQNPVYTDVLWQMQLSAIRKWYMMSLYARLLCVFEVAGTGMLVWRRGDSLDDVRSVSLLYVPDTKVRLIKQPEEPDRESNRTAVGQVQQIALVRDDNGVLHLPPGCGLSVCML
jgi:hypothetical protein